MAFRKSTLRKLQPFSRKLARLINELDSVQRRLKNLLVEAQEIELEARATRAMIEAGKEKGATAHELGHGTQSWDGKGGEA